MKNRKYIRKILITASLIAVFALSGCDEKDTTDTQTATTTDAAISTEAETEEKKTTSDEENKTKTTKKKTADKTDKSDKDDKKSTKTTDKNTKETSKKETKTTENTKKDSNTASNDTESKNTSNNGSTSNNSSNSSSKTTSGGSKNSSGGNSNSSSGSSGNSGSSQKTTEASKPSGTTECQHNWVWATKTVHHDAVTHVEEHYTEPYENPVYVTKIRCGICGTFYDSYDAYYSMDGCKGGYSENQVIDHYETVPAQLEWSETIVDKEAYDETVNDYQYCSKCGARK